jgi:hypothetical protein
MTLEELYYVSQIVAALMIFASLIFVGLQMRQSARNQRAVMHANRNQLITESLRLMGEPALARVYSAGAAAAPDMDALEVNQFVFLVRATLSSMQHQFLEWQEGLIDDARWKITRTALDNLLTSPGWRAAYLAPFATAWSRTARAGSPRTYRLCGVRSPRSNSNAPASTLSRRRPFPRRPSHDPRAG